MQGCVSADMACLPMVSILSSSHHAMFFFGGGEGGGRKLVNVIPMSIGSRSHFLVVKYWYRTQCCAALQRILRDILCNIVQYVFFTAA